MWYLMWSWLSAINVTWASTLLLYVQYVHVTAICSVTVTFTVTNLDHRDLIQHVTFFSSPNSKQNAKMPACAETQVESGFASCLKSASYLIWICRKSAKFSRLMIIQALGIRCISKKYFRVRFVLFLYFVLSFENCLIWAFASDGQLYIQDEDISKTKRQDAVMCRNSGWVRFLFLPKVWN